MYLRRGNWVTTACDLVGVSHSRFYAWIQRGEAEFEHIASGGKPRKREAVYLEFRDTIARARAQAEAASVARIRAAAAGEVPGDVRADQWWLERAFPDRWGRRATTATVEHSGKVDQDVTFRVIVPPPAVLGAAADEAEDAR